jgi:2-polyprenyl-6-methoxyphenol hydroxylase-like FAD-dependent oxidoreductase
VGITDGCEVAGYALSKDKSTVIGVTLADGTLIDTEFVVDCSGRWSGLSDGLVEAGYAPPPVLKIKSDVVYATRLMRQRESQDFLAIAQIAPPPGKRSAVAFAVEDGMWVVTLFGYHGDHPPRDDEGWRDFAGGLDQQAMAQLIDSMEPLTKVRKYHFRESQWRRFDKQNSRPARLLHLGDTVCSFNPIYGQGMTSATLQAEKLETYFTSRADPLARAHDEVPGELAKVINECWQAVASEDFRHAETTGDAMPVAAAVNWYTRRVHRLASRDDEVETRFLKVMHMEAGFASLFHPRVLVPALLRPV